MITSKTRSAAAKKDVISARGKNDLFDLHKLNFEPTRLVSYSLGGTNPSFEILIQVINFKSGIWNKANLHEDPKIGCPRLLPAIE